MCEVLDRVEQRGMERGLAEGLAEGRASGLAEGAEQRARQIALNLRDSLAMNDPAQVAQLVAMPVETVRRWFAGA